MWDIKEQQRALQSWLEQNEPAAELCLFGFSASLDPELKKDFTAAVRDFLAQWQAHQRPLSSDFFLFAHQFLWVAVSPSVPLSGCARDSLSRFVQNYFARRSDIFLMDANDVALVQFADMKKEKGHFLWVRRYSLPDFFQKKSEDDWGKISIVQLHFSSVEQSLSQGFLLPYSESFWAKSP